LPKQTLEYLTRQEVYHKACKDEGTIGTIQRQDQWIARQGLDGSV